MKTWLNTDMLLWRCVYIKLKGEVKFAGHIYNKNHFPQFFFYLSISFTETFSPDKYLFYGTDIH